MYRLYYPVIDYESSQIENENNLFLSEEQLAELEEIENGIYEIKIDKVQKNKNSRPNNNEKWRKDVLKRDDNTCQLCHCNNSTMHVHHIRKWIDYPELRTDVNNGITLCEKCHYKIYGKEKEYEEHFLQIIANKILNPRGENND
jgi:nitrate/TMAO reductase-like tetraheme cytochrome c subunit